VLDEAVTLLGRPTFSSLQKFATVLGSTNSTSADIMMMGNTPMLKLW